MPIPRSPSTLSFQKHTGNFLGVPLALLVLSGVLWCATEEEDASLIVAVKAGNLSAVQRTLQQKSNPNAKEADGTTALHWGVQEDRLDIVQVLINAGANVNARNEYGLTPLAWALNNGSAAMTQQLLKAGADLKAPVPDMGTALLAAAHTGNPEVIKALLKAGANVNEAERRSGQTALMWAAAEGHEAAVNALLAAGADSRARARSDETALFFAVRGGYIGVADALLAAGADVNERTAPDARGRRNTSVAPAPGDTVLVVAINNGHFNMANFLLSKGADPNMAGSHWTPLHAISRVRNYEETQYPPAIIKDGEMDSLELAKRLIAYGADPNARPLTTVGRRAGGDQNYKDLIGATPFLLAAKSGDVPYMRFLLSVGADATTPLLDHSSPLMVAAGIGCVPGQWVEPERDVLAAVKVLVDELDADVRAVNDQNENAVHGAICRGADSVVQYLADKGARFDVRDADGQTPLDVAVDGLFRSTSINGPRIIYFRFTDHMIGLVKKLTEEPRHVASTQASAQR
jgi:ankyrin repeat protein